MTTEYASNTDHTLENVVESQQMVKKLQYTLFPHNDGYRWQIISFTQGNYQNFIQPESEPTHTTATIALQNAQVYASQNNLK